MNLNKYIIAILLFIAFGNVPVRAGHNFDPVHPPKYFKEFTLSLYQKLNDPSLKIEAFESALKGFYKLEKEQKIKNKRYLTIIDMSLSANVDRFFLIDLQDGKIIRKSKVAHGRNSGGKFAKSFSNKSGSYQTSLGFYRTAEVYTGKHGKSLRLDGLENSNCNARKRAIVIHSADYVSNKFIANYGRLGRSLGCPALPKDGFSGVIDKIKEGSILFIYYPQRQYLSTSELINNSIQKIFEKGMPFKKEI
jgi:hypothetical protein